MGKFDFRDPSQPLRVPLWERWHARVRVCLGQWLSPRGALRLAYRVRRLEMGMHPRRKRRMMDLMERLLPPGTSRREVYRQVLLSRAIRRVGGHTFAPVSGRSRQWLLDALRPEGLDRLDAVREAGRGAVVLGTHSGLNAWVGPALIGLGYPVRLMQRRSISAEKYLLLQRNGWVGRVLGFPEPAQAGAHLKHLSELTRRGEWVQHVATSPRPRGGIGGTLLGRPVSCCPAPWAIARLTGAPVIPVLVLADADLRPGLVVGEPLTVSADGPAEAAMERAFRQYLAFLDARLGAAAWNVSLLDWDALTSPG